VTEKTARTKHRYIRARPVGTALYHHEAEGGGTGSASTPASSTGYVVQAGEFVVAAGFSGDAWEERTGWQGQLANGWAVV